jgi:hypothetical protein
MAERGHIMMKEHGRASWLTLIGPQLLACSTVLHPDTHQRERLRRLMAMVRDEDLMITLAFKEGLACLLYRNLLKSGLLDTLAYSQRERLSLYYHHTVLSNLRLIRDLKEILQRLNHRKIQVVLMQGIALLQTVYDDIGLRPLTDIDLWVLQNDYPGLISVLSDLGYMRDPVYSNTFRRRSTILDLHTHVLWADRIRAHRLLIRKGQEDIYHTTDVIDFEGQEARFLGRYDQIIYLSLHALKHHVIRLIWLVDIRNLLGDWERSDWEMFIRRARELGQEKTVSYIFFLLRHLFDFQPPKEVRQFLERKRPHFLEKKVLAERIRGYSLPIWAPLVLFSSGKGLQDRFFLILETLFPRPEVLRQIFLDSPDLGVWQLYLMRFLQLFGMVKISLKRKRLKMPYRGCC